MKIDARCKPNVVPYHIIDLSPMYEEEGDDNQIIRYGKDSFTLKELMDKLILNSIPPSDYDKVRIRVDFECRHRDPIISVSINVPKSIQEIEKETQEQQKLIDKKRALLAESRQIRQKKKEEKQKLINSLSKEQKALLGIK